MPVRRQLMQEAADVCGSFGPIHSLGEGKCIPAIKGIEEQAGDVGQNETGNDDNGRLKPHAGVKGHQAASGVNR